MRTKLYEKKTFEKLIDWDSGENMHFILMWEKV